MGNKKSWLKGQPFLFTAPSNIGLVHRPLKAGRRVRLPLELAHKIENKDTHFRVSFFLCETKDGVEPRSARADRRKGATDGTGSEQRRPGGSKHDVCDQRASTPVGAKINKRELRHSFRVSFFYARKTNGVEPRSERADRRKGATDGTGSEQRRPGGSKHDVCD